MGKLERATLAFDSGTQDGIGMPKRVPRMSAWHRLKQPPIRTIFLACVFILTAWLGYLLWTPGLDVRDGRHDRGGNGLWLQHGWLGGDDWFIRNGKTDLYARFRDRGRIRE